MGKRAASAIACIGVAALCPIGAFAQGYGRWSWDAVVGARTRFSENRVGGSVVSNLGQTNLDAGFGVTGFVVDPAIARFRVGLEALLTDSDGSASKGWGLRGELDVIPRGSHPFGVYFSRTAFDYSDIVDRDPATLRGVPETVTTFGGRFRAVRGSLRGLAVGFNRNGIASVVDNDDQQRSDRFFVDWSRGDKALTHHYRVERKSQDFGARRFRNSNLLLTADERGLIGPNWRWDFSAFGARRTAVQEITDWQSGRDTLRVRNAFTRTVGDNDRLIIRYNGGLIKPENGGTSHSHQLSASYLWHPSPSWRLGPSASYGLQVVEGTTFRTPEVGAQLGWNHNGTDWGTTMVTRLGVGTYGLARGGANRSDPFVSGAARVLVFQGAVTGFRKEVALEFTRNQMRLVNEDFFTLPDLGSDLPGTGTENSAQVRGKLSHRWGAAQLSGSGQYVRRESAGNSLQPDVFYENILFGAQLTVSRFNILVNVGEARTRGSSSQDVRSAGASVTYRPWVALGFRGSYRRDFRDLLLAPNVDGTRAEAGVEMRLGMFDLRVNAWMLEDRMVDASKRRSHGINARLSRNFFGWLPIVTGTRPRGVVR